MRFASDDASVVVRAVALDDMRIECVVPNLTEVMCDGHVMLDVCCGAVADGSDECAAPPPEALRPAMRP